MRPLVAEPGDTIVIVVMNEERRSTLLLTLAVLAVLGVALLLVFFHR